MEVPSGTLHWTAELYALLGYEPAGGPPPYDIAIGMHPEGYREPLQEAIDRCVSDGTPIDLESVVIDRSGRRLTARIRAEAVRDETGSIIGVRGVFNDITDVVTERESRISAQAELRETLDVIPDAVCFIDRSWRLSFINQATVELSGIDPERLATETLWEIFPELTSTSIRDVYEKAMYERIGGRTREYISRYGSWSEVTAYPVDSGIAVFVRDVTADQALRQEATEAAARAQEQAALIDASNEAMIMEDLDNVVTYWNNGAEQMYGWSRDEAVGRNIRELIYDDASVFEEPAAALLRDGRWVGEMTQRTKDGRVLTVECRWQAIPDEAGKPARLFAVNSDVTAQRRRQELESRAQRLESLGTLAGGIAHDLNNVLTPLLMTVQLMQKQSPTVEQSAMLEGMEVSVKRGADMIRQVLSFARGVDGVRDEVDMAELIDELASLALHTLPKSIEVDVDVDPSIRIVGDRTQVLQVLMNLVGNARDAMPSGGRLTIAVDRRTIGEDADSVTPLTPGDYARITVEDSGEGMGPAVLDKIFEPFFTTKELGEGTGLGLASSMAIVRSHAGDITAYSEPGVGSRFSVYLPASAHSPGYDQSVAPVAAVPSGNGELVLVVDDEESIRRVVTMTLQAHGYRTVEAGNGREAIEVFAEHKDAVRVVLTDMMMPVMDGAATAAYFFEYHPKVAVIAASGLQAESGVARARNSGVRHFLAKPFTAETLLRSVHDALFD